MKKKRFKHIIGLILVVFIVGVVIIVKSFVTYDTKVISVSDCLQGEWSVRTYSFSFQPYSFETTLVGTLTIQENSYTFHRLPNVEIPERMRKRFLFFDNPTGIITFEYEDGVHPNDDVRSFENHITLVRCKGISSMPYLIRVDHESEHLYFHSIISEYEPGRLFKDY